tara:strand:- start:496 stop:669 length:174 start_codon:yes stop_codon:yes gene_type:complete
MHQRLLLEESTNVRFSSKETAGILEVTWCSLVVDVVRYVVWCGEMPTESMNGGGQQT